MTRRLLALLTILLLAGGAGLWVGLEAGDGASEPDDRAGDPEVGGEPGSLSIPAAVVDFATLEGDSASLADYRGRVVLLNLWGTWCPPCRREIPDLVRLQDRIESRGATVVGLAVDSGSPTKIRAFADRYGINYPIWRSDSRTVIRHYRARGYPTTLLVDREGVIRKRWLGPQTAEELLAELRPYLDRG